MNIFLLKKKAVLPLFAALFFSLSGFFSCASQTRAEESYALGMAYFDLKRLDEAEIWFTQSKLNGKTRMASFYQLGRIAYEQGRYKEAETYFQSILSRDPKNTPALKAAAYTFAKDGNAGKALEYYRRVTQLLPNSLEETYNYALLLAVLDMNEEAEKVLTGTYSYAVNEDMILLLARVRRAQKKPEAVESYNAYLIRKNDPAVRFEYAETLEEQGHGTKAAQELETAIRGGYSLDAERIETLLGKVPLPDQKKTELRQIFSKS